MIVVEDQLIHRALIKLRRQHYLFIGMFASQVNLSILHAFLVIAMDALPIQFFKDNVSVPPSLRSVNRLQAFDQQRRVCLFASASAVVASSCGMRPDNLTSPFLRSQVVPLLSCAKSSNTLPQQR